MKKEIKMVTISFCMEADAFDKLIATLDSEILPFKRIEKIEGGSRTDEDGHSIIYKLDGETIFWSMINSNQKHYLVRADENILTPVQVES